MNGESFIKESKSKASRRVLAVPTEMSDELSNHLDLYPGPGVFGSTITMGKSGAVYFGGKALKIDAKTPFRLIKALLTRYAESRE